MPKRSRRNIFFQIRFRTNFIFSQNRGAQNIHTLFLASAPIYFIHMENTLKDINLYSTAELLDELGKRYDHAMFAGVQIVNIAGHTIHEQRFKGNTLFCMGMASKMLQFMGSKYDQGMAYYAGNDE